MKIKRLIISSFTIVLILSLSIPAFAVESGIQTVEAALAQYPLSQRLEDAKSGIIDENVSQEIIDSISVTFSTEDKTLRSASESAYAVRNLGLVSDDGQTLGTLYAVTAAEKTISDETMVDSIWTFITMVWIDHFGPDNEIVSVSGSWTASGRTITDRDVTYGYSGLDSYYSITAHPSSNTFSYNDLGVVGFRLFAESAAKISGTNTVIKVSVSPTIFD